jgi:DNA polymerase-3 subunit epsilon
MILFYDTETTGLPLFNQPSDHPDQPHIVQLALLLTEDDGTEIESENVIVKPDGWTISEEVSAIHGITQARAEKEGRSETSVTALFLVALARADIRVAHNEQFDMRIMRIAMLRAGYRRFFVEVIERLTSACTCIASTALVNCPPSARMIAKGMTRPKPPKLTECTEHFFGEKLVGAHDAMVDVRACARVYFHLKTLKGKAA